MYDIADLYKAEVTIPIAFEVAAQAPEDLPAVVRHPLAAADRGGTAFPRTRGGDPYKDPKKDRHLTFSPHTRG